MHNVRHKKPQQLSLTGLRSINFYFKSSTTIKVSYNLKAHKRFSWICFWKNADCAYFNLALIYCSAAFIKYRTE